MGLRRDGSTFPFHVAITKMELADGPVIVGFLTDLTERKKAEDEVRRSHDLLNAVVENTSDAIFVKDRSGRYLMLNHGGAIMAGVNDEEVTGKDDEFIFSPEVARMIKDEDKEVISRGETIAFETSVRIDEGEMTMSSKKTPLRDKDGKVIGIIGITRDITDRKKVEKALKESEAKYRGLFENIQEGVILRSLVFDDQGKVLDRILIEANPKALKDLGAISIEDVREKRDSEILSPENMAKMLKNMNEMMDTGNPLIEEVHFDANGRDYLLTTVLLGNDHIISTSVDITERKKMEDELKRSNAELQQFAYIASHRSKEPLRMVSSYLELIERRYKGKALDSKAEEYMHYAIDGADRMRRMIDDLLTYSRVDTHERSFVPVRMEEVLETALKDLRKSIEDSSASIMSTPMPEINADRTQMLVLLENLIGNAIKFRGERPQG